MNQILLSSPDAPLVWSQKYLGHHAIFDDFPPASGFVKADFNMDWVGTITHRSVFTWQFPDYDRNETAVIPSHNEEYFEWIDILQSVKDAAHTYTLVELGAGYGRWSAIGMLAARIKGIVQAKAILVEAEPKHIEWAHTHMAHNTIDTADYKLHEVAVGGKRDTILFWVSCPTEKGVATSQDWYGQSIVQEDMLKNATTTPYSYMGKKFLDLTEGWGAIEVDLVPLADVLADISFVDLVDMDVQGAEADVIENGMDALNQKVRRIHIGTHSHEVEGRIRTVMTKENWINVWDFPCQGESDTPYGRITFGDGVQSWLNPRLLDNASKPVAPPQGMRLF